MATPLEVLLIGFIAAALVCALPHGLPHLEGHATKTLDQLRSPIFRIFVTGEDQQLWFQRGICEILAVNLETSRWRQVSGWNRRPITSFSASRDGQVHLISLNGNEINVLRNDAILASEMLSDNASLWAAVSSSGQMAIRVVNRTATRVWDLSSSDPSSSEFTLRHPADRLGLSFSGDTLVVSGRDFDIDLYDVRSGKLILTLHGDEPVVADPVFSDDGRSLVIGRHHSLELWDLQTAQRAWSTSTAGDRPICAIAMSPDGNSIAAGTMGEGVRLIDARDGRTRHQLDQVTAAQKFAFSAASQQLYVGRSDGTIGVWSVETGQQIRQIETGVPLTNKSL